MLPVTLYFPAGIQTTPPPAFSAAWIALWIAVVASFTPVLSALYGGSVTTQLATTMSLVANCGMMMRGVPFGTPPGVGDGPGVGVFVGGAGVFVRVGVFVGPPGPVRVMSSNQMAPVGLPST